MEIIDRKAEIKALLKYSIVSIAVVLGVIISLYIIKSNQRVLLLPITGEEFNPVDWDWAHNLTYAPETDEYCDQDTCVSRENLIKEFELQIETLDPTYDTSKIRTYKELAVYLQTKDQSDCPFGYVDATPEDNSHDNGDCLVRE